MINISDKKVLIFGLGLNEGGVGAAKFFAKNGALVKITDLKSKEILQDSLDKLEEFPNIGYILGEHRNEDIDWADLIIKNPGVKPGNQYIEYAKSIGKQIETDIGIFLQFVKSSQIIGITGTKGKSTTSSLIYEILRSSEKEAIFGGNIGKSVLDSVEHIKENTLVVLELSSFQLESFEDHKVSPKYAVITNITPDHLNYYENMDEYIQAKKIIAKYQTKDDFLFLRKDDPKTSKPEFLKDLKSEIIYFSENDLPANFNLKLLGEHNKQNAAAALAVAKALGIDQKTALEAMKNFKGVDFRMQLIKEYNGIKIYNDTTSTGPDAGIKALLALPNSILIAGGMNKNMPYDEYAAAVDKYAKKVFFLTGDSTDEIKRLMQNKDLIAGTYNNLDDLLKDLKDYATSGDTILFSPAATSFNLFQNEFDRGRKFNAAAEKIFI